MELGRTELSPHPKSQSGATVVESRLFALRTRTRVLAVAVKNRRAVSRATLSSPPNLQQGQRIGAAIDSRLRFRVRAAIHIYHRLNSIVRSLLRLLLAPKPHPTATTAGPRYLDYCYMKRNEIVETATKLLGTVAVQETRLDPAGRIVLDFCLERLHQAEDPEDLP
ncbi:hypothetical protein PMIN03_005997 [Paraphaeosphaeria minitans]